MNSSGSNALLGYYYDQSSLLSIYTRYRHQRMTIDGE